MKVYIAGPISLGGTLYWDAIEQNMACFKRAATWLNDQGYEPLDPTETIGDPAWSWREWMVPALHKLVEADAICLLPGWHHSRGAIVEFTLANGLGLAVIDLPDEVAGRDRIEAKA